MRSHGRLGSIPPATFRDRRYLVLALGGGLIAFVASRWLARLELPIVVLDAVGLSVFAVVGTAKALMYGLQGGLDGRGEGRGAVGRDVAEVRHRSRAAPGQVDRSRSASMM